MRRKFRLVLFAVILRVLLSVKLSCAVFENVKYNKKKLDHMVGPYG